MLENITFIKYICPMNLKLILCFLLAFLCLEAYSQKKSGNTDIKKALDDGMYGNTNNLLRFRIGPTLKNYYGASIERKFAPWFGLEGGAYVKIGNLSPLDKLKYEGSYGMEGVKPKGGFGFMISPKFYARRNHINNGAYWGLRYTKQFYKVEIQVNQFDNPSNVYTEKQKVNAVFSNYTLCYGFHRQIASRIVIGAEFGSSLFFDRFKDIKHKDLDLNTNKTTLKVSDELKGDFYPHFDLCIGYLF